MLIFFDQCSQNNDLNLRPWNVLYSIFSKLLIHWYIELQVQVWNSFYVNDTGDLNKVWHRFFFYDKFICCCFKHFLSKTNIIKKILILLAFNFPFGKKKIFSSRDISIFKYNFVSKLFKITLVIEENKVKNERNVQRNLKQSDTQTSCSMWSK